MMRPFILSILLQHKDTFFNGQGEALGGSMPSFRANKLLKCPKQNQGRARQSAFERRGRAAQRNDTGFQIMVDISYVC
eukprot:scaffold2230_cov166-Skeletonema_menzelii.AAC.2